MQTNQLVSPGEYLASAYEPDAELVDGAIEERPVAQRDHAKWQFEYQHIGHPVVGGVGPDPE